MANALKISEACSLAMHALAKMAYNSPEMVRTPQVAQELGASEAHLSKVMQRLVKSELIHSIRGPHGGFNLAKPAEDITLMDIYEAIEGHFEPAHCLLPKPACDGKNCILGGMISSINHQVQDYLRKTTLAQLAGRNREIMNHTV